MDADLYAALEGDGALGGRSGLSGGGNATWKLLMDHLRDRLGCSKINLKLGLALMKQDGRATKEFAREFQRRALDAEMSDDDAKAQLVSSLDKDTLIRLDNYMMREPGVAASHKETAEERLRRVSYASMIAFLQQSNLTDIARQGAGGTGLSKPKMAIRPGFANVVEAAGEGSGDRDSFPGFSSGFSEAGVLTITDSTMAQPSTSTAAKSKKAKGKQPRRGPSSSSGDKAAKYQPVDVPPKDELMKVYTIGLAAADQIFPADLCKNPLPMLATVMGILTVSEESTMLPEADKAEVSDAISYLAERVATVTSLVDPSAPSVNAFESLPRGEGGRRRGPMRTVMFDVARGLARRVPLTKLVALDGDIRPYLASLMVAALHRAGEKLVIPNDLHLERVTREQFENMLAQDAGRTYDNYGTIASQLLGRDGLPEEAEKVQRDRMERQMAEIAQAVSRITQ